MSRLLRVAAAVLFLTVLVIKPAPVRASAFDTCTLYQAAPPFYAFTCGDSCELLNIEWPPTPELQNCIIAQCQHYRRIGHWPHDPVFLGSLRRSMARTVRV